MFVFASAFGVSSFQDDQRGIGVQVEIRSRQRCQFTRSQPSVGRHEVQDCPVVIDVSLVTLEELIPRRPLIALIGFGHELRVNLVGQRVG